jgi:hypothetical protein
MELSKAQLIGHRKRISSKIIPKALAPRFDSRLFIQVGTTLPFVFGCAERSHLIPCYKQQKCSTEGRMRTALGAFAPLLLAGQVCIQPARAQPAPEGSYLNSCRHAGVEGDRLFADCRRIDGSWQRTVLDIDRCAGDIVNINGRLSCNRGPREGYYGSSGPRDWREQGYNSSQSEDWRDERRARCAAIFDPYERQRCWRSW